MLQLFELTLWIAAVSATIYQGLRVKTLLLYLLDVTIALGVIVTVT